MCVCVCVCVCVYLFMDQSIKLSLNSADFCSVDTQGARASTIQTSLCRHSIKRFALEWFFHFWESYSHNNLKCRQKKNKKAKNEINKTEVWNAKCSTKQGNRVTSESPKGQIIYQVTKAAMQNCHILSLCVRVCVLCVQLCYIMLLLEGWTLSATLHIQILHVTVVQLCFSQHYQ